MGPSRKPAPTPPRTQEAERAPRPTPSNQDSRALSTTRVPMASSLVVPLTGATEGGADLGERGPAPQACGGHGQQDASTGIRAQSHQDGVGWPPKASGSASCPPLAPTILLGSAIGRSPFARGFPRVSPSSALGAGAQRWCIVTAAEGRGGQEARGTAEVTPAGGT